MVVLELPRGREQAGRVVGGLGIGVVNAQVEGAGMVM